MIDTTDSTYVELPKLFFTNTIWSMQMAIKALVTLIAASSLASVAFAGAAVKATSNTATPVHTLAQPGNDNPVDHQDSYWAAVDPDDNAWGDVRPDDNAWGDVRLEDNYWGDNG